MLRKLFGRLAAVQINHQEGRILPRSKESGFTLVEVLVAIFIVSLVFSVLYSSYTGTLKLVNDTEHQIEIYKKVSIATQRIVEDLESVALPATVVGLQTVEGESAPPAFEGNSDTINEQNADSLSFYSYAHIDFNELSDSYQQARISYFLKEDTEKGELVLYRSDLVGHDLGGQEAVEDNGVVLCDGLAGVDFSYVSGEGVESETWPLLAEDDGSVLPALVIVTLEFLHSSEDDKKLKFKTKIALRLITDGNDT